MDYVYEPGQFSLRGSLLDVYSNSSEFPFRIDFFGDEVDSIRTFDVQDQLSLKKMEHVSIIPASGSGEGATLQSFLSFLPADTLLITRDVAYVADCVRQIWTEGFSAQALVVEAAEKDVAQGAGAGSPVSDSKAAAPLVRARLLAEPVAFRRQLEQFRTIMLAASAPQSADVQLEAHTTAQPIFHKNFELLFQAFPDYQERDYDIYVLSDNPSQTDRLESIFPDRQLGIRFTPVDRTLHAGFVDDDLHLCCFTDHQILDRFHRYTLRSDRTRNGRVALTLKELQQFQVGDYVVHIAHGVGRFGGLLRIPNGDTWQEVI